MICVQELLKMFRFKNIAVAVSGGVDSSVAAFLLKKKGFNVQAVFMENWDVNDEKGYCSSDADYADAMDLCKFLNIKLHKVSFVKQYWNEVFCNVIKDYESGLTPNPDVLCNRHIKFNYLYDYVINKLGADAIATGHYACSSYGSFLENYEPNKVVKLLKAKDPKKEQLLFLSQVQQEALRRTMFPLGSFLKSEVKSIAFQYGLEKFAKKKESMGICFIGTRDFQNFIREYIEDKPGNFIDIDTGKVIGEHRGLHQWTLGQRSKISGLPKAYFIARKNIEKNEILVAGGTEHNILYSRLFFTSTPHWIAGKPEELQNEDILECEFQFQNTQDWVPCVIFECNKGLIVELKTTKRAVTPGQYAAFCKGNECLGSARIVHTPVSEFSVKYMNNSNEEKDIEIEEKIEEVEYTTKNLFFIYKVRKF